MSPRIQAFLKPHIFFIRIREDGVLNRSGEQSQNNAVSVSGFTGFVWTEARFVFLKSMQFQKYSDSCGGGLALTL